MKSIRTHQYSSVINKKRDSVTKQAPSLSVGAVAALEVLTGGPRIPEAKRIFISGICLLAHASLRFGDPKDVIELKKTESAIKGTLRRTKTEIDSDNLLCAASRGVEQHMGGPIVKSAK